MFGFYRFASVCPTLKVADTAYNTAEIIRCATEAIDEGAAFVVFPELCITGYTCSDLFHQELLLKKSVESLSKIAEAFAKSDTVIAVGLPLRMFGCLYNCAAFVQKGKTSFLEWPRLVAWRCGRGCADLPSRRVWRCAGDEFLYGEWRELRGTCRRGTLRRLVDACASER